jgi:hypothetical protein
MIGRKRCLKFRIGPQGNIAYEALLDDPLCKVIKEQVYNSFEELFVAVWFEDMNIELFDPGKYMPSKTKKEELEKEDAEVSGEPGSPD